MLSSAIAKALYAYRTINDPPLDHHNNGLLVSVNKITTLAGSNDATCNLFELRRISMDDTDRMISFTLRITGTHALLKRLLGNQ